MRSELSVEEYQNYLSYEIMLDKLYQMRSATYKKNNPLKRPQLDLLRNIETTFIQHINYVFERAIRRFPSEFSLWENHIQFLKEKKANNILNTLFGKAIALFPKKSIFWIQSALFELEENNNMHSARVIMQRAIRTNPDDPLLWEHYFKLEIFNIIRYFERQRVLLKLNQDGTTEEESPEDKAKALEIKTEEFKSLQAPILVVFKHAMEHIPDIAKIFSLHAMTYDISSILYESLQEMLKAKYHQQKQCWEHLTNVIIQQWITGAASITSLVDMMNLHAITLQQLQVILNEAKEALDTPEDYEWLFMNVFMKMMNISMSILSNLHIKSTTSEEEFDEDNLIDMTNIIQFPFQPLLSLSNQVIQDVTTWSSNQFSTLLFQSSEENDVTSTPVARKRKTKSTTTKEISKKIESFDNFLTISEYFLQSFDQISSSSINQFQYIHIFLTLPLFVQVFHISNYASEQSIIKYQTLDRTALMSFYQANTQILLQWYHNSSLSPSLLSSEQLDNICLWIEFIEKFFLYHQNEGNTKDIQLIQSNLLTLFPLLTNQKNAHAFIIQYITNLPSSNTTDKNNKKDYENTAKYFENILLHSTWTTRETKAQWMILFLELSMEKKESLSLFITKYKLLFSFIHAHPHYFATISLGIVYELIIKYYTQFMNEHYQMDFTTILQHHKSQIEDFLQTFEGQSWKEFVQRLLQESCTHDLSISDSCWNVIITFERLLGNHQQANHLQNKKRRI